MKNLIIKRTISYFTAVILAVFMVVPAYAATTAPEEVNVVATETNSVDTISPRYSSTPGFNAGYISGGYGELKVSIGKYVSTGYLQAAVSPNKNSGSINVAVKFPSGTIVGLGSMPASGGSTMLKTAHGLVAGTYTFIFEPTSLATFNVMGYIYE